MLQKVLAATAEVLMVLVAPVELEELQVLTALVEAMAEMLMVAVAPEEQEALEIHQAV